MTPRRSFLTGRLTWRPSSFLPSAPPPKAAENRLSFRSIPDRSLFGPMTSISRRAMATAFEFLVNDPAEDGFRGRPAAEIALDALDKIDLVEEILSVFRSGSVVSRINACASEFDVPLAEPFRHWFEKSLALGRLSDGAFDIAAGSLWEGWGFARREGRFPTEEERAEALARSGVKHLSIDEDRQVIRLDREGVILNFGGIGKGIGLDEAAGAAEAQGLKDFLVQGGRSGAVARGGRRGDHSPALRRDVWTVSVADPLRPDHPLAMIRLADRALATSGSAEQFFIYEGKRYSHILDPATGFPAAGLLSVTVLGPTAAEADALSTAMFVMGEKKTVAFCQDHPEYSALLVTEEKTGSARRLIAVNMDEDTLSILAEDLPVEIF